MRPPAELEVFLEVDSSPFYQSPKTDIEIEKSTVNQRKKAGVPHFCRSLWGSTNTCHLHPISGRLAVQGALAVEGTARELPGPQKAPALSGLVSNRQGPNILLKFEDSSWQLTVKKKRVPEDSEARLKVDIIVYCHIYYHILSYIIIYYHILSKSTDMVSGWGFLPYWHPVHTSTASTCSWNQRIADCKAPKKEHDTNGYPCLLPTKWVANLSAQQWLADIFARAFPACSIRVNTVTRLKCPEWISWNTTRLSWSNHELRI